MTADFDVRIEWSRDDLCYAAVFLRDGQPWFLDGALVGMGTTRDAAVAELCGIARHLVIHGENFLTDLPGVSLADREWLFALLDPGDTSDEMYVALQDAKRPRPAPDPEPPAWLAAHETPRSER